MCFTSNIKKNNRFCSAVTIMNCDLSFFSGAILAVLLIMQISESGCVSYSGSKNRSNASILLGGLFSVHSSSDGNTCGSIDPGPFINVEAMAFAISHINQRDDILPNITLGFDIRDTCGLSNIALEEVVGLMQLHQNRANSSSSISGVVGAERSDVSISVASLLRIFQVPQISHSSTATVLSDKERFDYFFRTIPPDNLQARAIADLIVHFNWTYVLAVNTDDTYGRGGISSLIQELEQQNGTNVCVITEPGITTLPINAETSNYVAVVDFINREWINNVSVAVLFAQNSIAIGLLETMKDMSVKYPKLKNLTWIASDAWSTRIPEDIQGFVQGMLGIVPRIQHIRAFEDHIESLNPMDNRDNPWLVEYWENNFNCSLNPNNMSYDACDASLSLNPEEVIKGNGVTYVVDAIYSFAKALHDMISSYCTDGNLCPEITQKRFSSMAINGTVLRSHLYNVSIRSPSSNTVMFDMEGNDQNGFYEIVNLGTNGTFFVGEWNNMNRLNLTHEVQWNTGSGEQPISICSAPCGSGQEPVLVPERSECCWTCEACIGDRTISTGAQCIECENGFSPNSELNECIPNPITFLQWSDPWAIVIIICASVGICTTGFVIAVFVIFHKHRIIKATSRELSAILFTGIALCYILPFFFIAEPSPAICAIRRFGFGFCFSLCFSPLLMKTNRIYRVFKQAPRTPRYANTYHQVIFSCLLILIQVLIVIIWLVIDHPSTKLSIGRTTTEKLCGESPYVRLPISLLYNLLLLSLSTYFAFLARKIPANFNEAKFIGVTLYGICIIWLGFVPTYIGTVQLGAVYQTSSLIVAILLSATTILTCLFIPKILLLFIQIPKEKKKQCNRTGSVDIITELSSVGTLDYNNITN